MPARAIRPPCALLEADIRVLEQTNGLPIGIGTGDYDEKTLLLEPGARLYFYSDGITEAMSADDELFGPDRLIESVGELRSRTLEDSVAALMDQVKAWREGGSVKDDISLLAVEVTP